MKIRKLAPDLFIAYEAAIAEKIEAHAELVLCHEEIYDDGMGYYCLKTPDGVEVVGLEEIGLWGWSRTEEGAVSKFNRTRSPWGNSTVEEAN